MGRQREPNPPALQARTVFSPHSVSSAGPVTGMDQISFMTKRVHDSASLPALLDAGFGAFEVIRAAARACEDRAPDLFAAFMLAAGSAAEGRNALLAATSLPRAADRPPLAEPMPPSHDVAQIADEITTLARLMYRRLLHAATIAAADDRAACQRAAQAAAEIDRLLSPDPR